MCYCWHHTLLSLSLWLSLLALRLLYDTYIGLSCSMQSCRFNTTTKLITEILFRVSSITVISSKRTYLFFSTVRWYPPPLQFTITPTRHSPPPIPSDMVDRSYIRSVLKGNPQCFVSWAKNYNIGIVRRNNRFPNATYWVKVKMYLSTFI